MKVGYLDSPYLGCCGMYDHFHGEDGLCWDDPETHRLLIVRACDEFPDGWALSLHAPSLRVLLPMCPDDVRVSAWCKTWHQIRPTTVQFAWEPVIFRGGRKDPKRSPMIRDWMACAVTRKRGLKGAKPDQFNQWVLDLLAFDPEQDEIDDIFPGTAGMGATLSAPPLNFGGVA